MDKCIEKYFLTGDKLKKSEEFDNFNTTKGKSLYEVIRINDGIPIFLIEHLERLENSAKIMEYNLSVTRNEIIDRINKLIFENKVNDGNIKLVINYDPLQHISENTNIINEKFLVYFVPHSYPTQEQYTEEIGRAHV